MKGHWRLDGSVLYATVDNKPALFMNPDEECVVLKWDDTELIIMDRADSAMRLTRNEKN